MANSTIRLRPQRVCIVRSQQGHRRTPKYEHVEAGLWTPSSAWSRCAKGWGGLRPLAFNPTSQR